MYLASFPPTILICGCSGAIPQGTFPVRTNGGSPVVVLVCKSTNIVDGLSVGGCGGAVLAVVVLLSVIGLLVLLELVALTELLMSHELLDVINGSSSSSDDDDEGSVGAVTVVVIPVVVVNGLAVVDVTVAASVVMATGLAVVVVGCTLLSLSLC